MSQDATTRPRAAVRAPTTAARPLAVIGLSGPLIAAVLVGALHVLPDTAAISPYSRTISEYALT